MTLVTLVLTTPLISTEPEPTPELVIVPLLLIPGFTVLLIVMPLAVELSFIKLTLHEAPDIPPEAVSTPEPEVEVVCKISPEAPQVTAPLTVSADVAPETVFCMI